MSKTRQSVIRTFSARFSSVHSMESAERRNLIQFLNFQLDKTTALPLQIPLPRDERARRLADRIMADPGSGQSLPQLSTECSTSLRTMQRLFRKELGIPLARWRAQVRMLQSVRLLANGHNVTQTALNSGFDSLSAFIHSFRRHFGEAPGDYLKRTAIPGE